MISKKSTILFFLLFFLSKNIFAIDNCQLWVDSVFSTMSLDEKIGQLFISNIPAKANSRTINVLKKEIENQHIGGILFWKGTIEDQAELTNIAQAKSKIPLFIALDGEWGLAMRLKDAIRYPRKTTLAALSNDSLIYQLGEEIGKQCNELGINMNFDPVLDVNLNPENPVINTRSFGDDPIDIAEKASLFVKGLESKKILSVGKHFPGHGDTSQDSHKELAIVTHDSATISNVDLLPYYKLINNGMPAVMVGHIAVPSIDSTYTPASLSPKIINDLLKEQLQFEGLVITDAMKMEGVSHQKDASVRALLAGNDILLDPQHLCSEFQLIKDAIKDSILSEELINEKCKKVLRFKYKYGIHKTQPVNIKNITKRINTPNAKLLQQKTIDESITIIKNHKNILPIKDLDQHIAIISVGASDHTKFIQTANLYTKTDNYTLEENAPLDSIHELKCKIENADLLIMAIHSRKIPDSLISIASGDKKVILVSFRSPYELKNYPISTDIAEAVVMGYENLQMMQKATAQIIFGGIAAKGYYPISTEGIAKKRTGYKTEKIRLNYNIPESVGIDADTLQLIDSLVLAGIKEKATPGCQVLIAKDNTIIYHKSFGHHDYSNNSPVKNTDIYDIASLTKVSVTLPLIMKLYDEHNIDLDKKIKHYLKDLKHTEKGDITIRELLMHQAGLKPFIPFYRQAITFDSITENLFSSKRDSIYNIQVSKKLFANKNYKYKDNFVTNVFDANHSIQIADSLFLIKNYKDSIWQQIIDSPLKEKKYRYSDLSFLILQKIIEEKTNSTLDVLINNYYYKKLGANYSGYLPLQRIDKTTIIPTENDQFLRKQLIQGYVHDENAAFLGGVAGHAGNFSNTNDLVKLFQMILNKGAYGEKEYLSEETCDYFLSEKSDISRRGLGFDRYFAGNDTLIGHTGFTGTCVWMDPKNNLIYIFLSNRIHPHKWNKKLMYMDIRTDIIDVIYNAFIDRKKK